MREHSCVESGFFETHLDGKDKYEVNTELQRQKKLSQ